MDFTKKELLYLDTALTSFINERKKIGIDNKKLNPYFKVWKKVMHMIHDKNR